MTSRLEMTPVTNPKDQPPFRLIILGAGFEEVELLDASGWIVLLDAVVYGGPQRSSCGPVSRRVRLGWRSLPSTEGVLIGSGPARIGAGEGLRA